MAKLAKVAKVGEVAKIAKVEAGRGGLWWRDFSRARPDAPKQGKAGAWQNLMGCLASGMRLRSVIPGCGWGICLINSF